MFKKIIMFIACGFGTGYAPVAPGTVGSLLGILFYFIMTAFPFKTQIIMVAVLIVVALITSHIAAKILNQKDPGCIVIDEIAGQTIAVWGLEFTFVNMLAGFIFFRFFDILKPYPIKKIELKLPGGLGITADDLVAGVFARIIMLLFVLIYKIAMPEA